MRWLRGKLPKKNLVTFELQHASERARARRNCISLFEGREMTTPQSVLELVDIVADEALRAGVSASDGVLPAQAAFVRSLADEVQRRPPSEHWVAPLHALEGSR